MLKTVIKDLITNTKFTGITINIGFIGLNFAGGFSKGEHLYYILTYVDSMNRLMC